MPQDLSSTNLKLFCLETCLYTYAGHPTSRDHCQTLQPTWHSTRSARRKRWPSLCSTSCRSNTIPNMMTLLQNAGPNMAKLDSSKPQLHTISLISPIWVRADCDDRAPGSGSRVQSSVTAITSKQDNDRHIQVRCKVAALCAKSKRTSLVLGS